MKNKVLLIVGIAILIIAIIVAAVLLGRNGGNENTSTANINIEEIGKTISEKSPFNEMATMDITTEELENYYQVNIENVEKVVGKMPMMNIHASMYLLVEAKEGKVNDVKAQVETFGNNYEEQWSRYLPQQYDLVSNRKIGVVGNCVYLVIAEDAEEIVKLIK